ncbi:hypothetical protein CH289_27500 [Rhodococcus sp. RS1C4]|nr:hypothetical protein CH289_27500 [Rhodococcus sp. RS1C4]
MMTKTHNTRNAAIFRALTGLVAIGVLALVLWISAPTANTGGLAPESPVSTTTYWTMIGVTAAITVFVFVPLAFLVGPKIIRRWIHRTNDSSTRD